MIEIITNPVYTLTATFCIFFVLLCVVFYNHRSSKFLHLEGHKKADKTYSMLKIIEDETLDEIKKDMLIVKDRLDKIYNLITKS